MTTTKTNLDNVAHPVLCPFGCLCGDAYTLLHASTMRPNGCWCVVALLVLPLLMAGSSSAYLYSSGERQTKDPEIIIPHPPIGSFDPPPPVQHFVFDTYRESTFPDCVSSCRTQASMAGLSCHPGDSNCRQSVSASEWACTSSC